MLWICFLTSWISFKMVIYLSLREVYPAAFLRIFSKRCLNGSRTETSSGSRNTNELLLNVLKDKPFLVKPSEKSLKKCLEKICTPLGCRKRARKLQSMVTQNVLVSMAEKGALLIDDTGAVHICPAYQRRGSQLCGCRGFYGRRVRSRLYDRRQ